MGKGERDEACAALTGLILSSLLDEFILDCTLQAHREVAKSTTICKVCNTRCSSVHLPNSLAAACANQNGSRSGTPSSIGDKSHTGTNTPTNGKSDGNLLLECIQCNRQVGISVNFTRIPRCSCMGLSNSRRGAPRSGTKLKAPSDAGRSASPSSEAYLSDDRSVGKSKSYGKGKQDDEYTLKRKRPLSPQVTPSKKSKSKLSGEFGLPSNVSYTHRSPGSPISRVKADPVSSGVPGGSHYSPTTKSQSRIPSKLRDSSIAPDHYSSSSRSSSPEAGSIPTPASSSFTRSPNLSSRPVTGTGRPRGRPPGSGTGPPKRPSPPRLPAAPVIHHFGMDVDGEETVLQPTPAQSDLIDHVHSFPSLCTDRYAHVVLYIYTKSLRP
ncbi:hypothetical protein CC1G_13625 [Coprinopsis cinerea okayama7|uniref:Uncharacterized protein n=1 Tax=Coprinopsis cinerea (strain Okayama-7 / 130 / ATCC MYA-4618 / FGSC 9003) TaxID=240176 RepID=D6RK02_COPC7|nr:hypothetical protein CC1G_13625 [Coprinopsis cinerea okayama7\|eukprot:XP_002912092.1 hypothetical protein CC1G_13625 [Coprinopsis cinerea okayama7\